ncbi:hypothetical protein KBZ00_25920 [Streptomyces sp. RK31]|uniref:DUF6221 family protein n=1 Tax=Streptomyces sp. RK31 TaxID=2824892 RepID=UPI001B37CC32|nr:DUF6221 family protein [Streptomyces sp. RK31]MBQ0974538.1 hypothetical protein [Streptomyces sp. RK31]
MDELVRWLRAQLDEDERTARATEWDGSGNKLDWELMASATIDVGGDEFYVGDRTIANHMMAWDPARVLREIDAKRQSLAHYARIREHTKRGDEAYVLAEGAVAKQIQIMATAYDHRPGHREEWRP